MEWYMRRDGDEMIVPQDQEQSDQSHSQDNSFQWEEGLSMCGELPASNYGMWGSEPKIVGDWLGYQLDGLSEMDQMNDNFMSSFLEKDSPHMRNTYQSVGISPEPSMPFDNLMADMGLESQGVSQDQSCRGNLRYLEVPSTMDWDKLDDSPTYIPYDSKKSKGSLTRNGQISETSTSLMVDGQVDEETSLEETTLQELNVAMIQMTEETRICFRDALYRLAKSSGKQQFESQSQRGEQNNKETSLSNVHRATSRSEKLEHMESKTNYFDSTVAHLMFNELNNNNLIR